MPVTLGPITFDNANTDVREQHEIPRGGAVDLVMPVWMQTLQVRARMEDPSVYGGRMETSCCRQPDRQVDPSVSTGSGSGSTGTGCQILSTPSARNPAHVVDRQPW